jgi:hypothetical protein
MRMKVPPIIVISSAFIPIKIMLDATLEVRA